jgi:hypothetical protein
MFSRTATFIAFLLAFALLVTAVPTKRSNADVEAVFNTLKSKTASVLPQFGGCPIRLYIHLADPR